MSRDAALSKAQGALGRREGMLTALVLGFETFFLYCKGPLCPSGSGSRAKIGGFSFSVSLARETVVLWAHRRELCLCLKQALSREESCGRGGAGNRTYIFQQAQTHSSSWASTCQSKSIAQGGSFLHQGSGRAEGWG